MDKKDLQKLLRDFDMKPNSSSEAEKIEQLKALQALERLANHFSVEQKNDSYTSSEERRLEQARIAADNFIQNFEHWAAEVQRLMKK